MTKATYKIDGMDCAEEVAVLKREFAPLVLDVEQVAFDVINGTMTIDLTEKISDDMVRSAVAKTGMTAQPWSAGGKDNAGENTRRRRTVATTLSGLALAATILAQGFHHGTARAALDALGGSDEYGLSNIAIVFAAISILSGSWYVLPKAANAAKPPPPAPVNK